MESSEGRVMPRTILEALIAYTFLAMPLAILINDLIQRGRERS
jgi:hypothetical protein